MKVVHVPLAGAAALGIAGSLAGAAPQYTATILPQIDTTNDEFSLTYTSPFALNNLGQVTGDLGDGMGFLWSPGTGWSNLLPAFGDAYGRAVGTGINDHGWVVGSANPAGGFGAVPFVFDSAGNVVVLPTLGAGLSAGASDINNAGMIVGSAETAAGGTFGGPTAAVYWQNGQIHVIGGFGGDYSVASAVNEHGVVAGHSNAAPGQAVRAYRWTEGGGFETLESLIANMPTLAQDINDSGVVVGHAALSLFANVPVYWDEQGNLHTLGQLDANAIDVSVLGINNDNVMVGFELVSDTFRPEARLWIGGEVFDLNDLVAGLPEGMLLSSAVDINDLGQIIVEAQMEVDGQLQFFSVLLTPVPAPGAGAALALAGLAAARRRRG